MNNQETETKTLTEETPKVRKRKILTDPEGIRAKCKSCLEPGNLENLIRHRIPVKSLAGVELFGAFEYVYLCSENCKALFLLSIIRQK
jgi:hypothetical protein